MRIRQTCLNFLAMILVLCLFVPGAALADQDRNLQGWERDGKYNKMINWKDFEHFKGIVVDIKEEAPLSGMTPATILHVRESDFDVIDVHVGPSWFVGKLYVNEGDRVSIRGSWAKINDKLVFIASKIKLGETVLIKVRRTKDGTPFWTMSYEEMVEEGFVESEAEQRGWEVDGAYQKKITWKEPEKIKGVIMGMREVVPLEGMTPGLAMIIQAEGSDTITAHIGPKWFVGDLGFREGDKVIVYGVRAKIEGHDVLIVSKVKKGEFFEFKVRRSEDGVPYWTIKQID